VAFGVLFAGESSGGGFVGESGAGALPVLVVAPAGTVAAVRLPLNPTHDSDTPHRTVHERNLSFRFHSLHGVAVNAAEGNTNTRAKPVEPRPAWRRRGPLNHVVDRGLRVTFYEHGQESPIDATPLQRDDASREPAFVGDCLDDATTDTAHFHDRSFRSLPLPAA
jgi:hypothetical protein